MDYSSTTSSTASWTYSEPGIYAAVFYAYDNDGGACSSEVQITIFPKNQPPTATLEVEPSEGEAPLQIQVTASGEDDKEIVKYQLIVNRILEGETTEIVNIEGKNPISLSRVLEEPGEYEITLTVWDAENETDSVMKSMEVKVLPQEPSETEEAREIPDWLLPAVTVAIVAAVIGGLIYIQAAPGSRKTSPSVVGFHQDPNDANKVIPDDTELRKPPDKIGPMKFYKKRIIEDQFPPNDPRRRTAPDARWQHREAPKKKKVSNHITAWTQEIHVQSYRKNGKSYRGGEYLVHFRWKDGCEGGSWRQLVRETVYVGDGTGNLKIAKLEDGQYIPKHPQPDPVESGRGQWKIDTNPKGRQDKNPDYPHQDKGEMFDSPDRALSNLEGFYSDNKQPNRTPALVIAKEVEFLTFYVDPAGKICGIIKWSFMVKIRKGRRNDNNVNHAVITTEFREPKNIDPKSKKGTSAIETYKNVLDSELFGPDYWYGPQPWDQPGKPRMR
jgi:PKD repeat protein